MYVEKKLEVNFRFVSNLYRYPRIDDPEND